MWNLTSYFMGILLSLILPTVKLLPTSMLKFLLHALILIHYKLCPLHVAYASPDEGQSSHSIFTVTETSYIQVTQNHCLHMEPASLYERQSSHPSFSQLLHHTSGLLHDTSGYPKFYHGYI